MIEEQKSKLVVIVGVIAMIVIILAVVVVMFIYKKNPAPDVAPTQTVSTPQPVAVKAVPSNKDLIKIINKDSILRSTDAGDTFAPYFKISTSEQIGLANVLAITFHPLVQGRIIVGSYEDGLFSKNTEGDTWDIISFPPKKIYSFILDKNNPDQRMFASGVVEGNGRIFRTNDGGETWKAVYVEPGQSSTITALSQNPRNTNTIYSGTSQGTIVKSIDGGNTWKNSGGQISGLIKYISFDAAKPLAVYLLSFQKKMYYSPNEGGKWIDWEQEKADEVTALYKQANDLAKQGNKAGADSFRKKADALKQRNTENKMPNGINLIVADPKISGTIYAGTNSGLFRSKDFGKYWSELDIIKSAKSYPIRSIAINPKDSKEVVFVAGKAFYKSRNSGSTWSVTPLNSDRTASFVAYDPFDPNSLFIGVSSI